MAHLHSLVISLFLAVIQAAPQMQTQAPADKTEPHLSVRGEPQFLARIMVSELEVSGPAIQTCIIIYPDRFFRLEKAIRKTGDVRKRQVVVGGDKLSNEEATQLEKILRDPDVAKLDASATRKPFPFKDKLQVVYASIPRGKIHVQSVAAVATETRPLELAAVMLAEFLTSIESRDVPVYKNAQPNNCREPSSAVPLTPPLK
jgi:hypothetical protein